MFQNALTQKNMLENYKNRQMGTILSNKSVKNLAKLRDTKHNHIIFGVSEMISNLGQNLWSSILEPYLDYIGFGAVYIGFIKTMNMFSQCLANLLLGGLSDKIGRKNPIIFSFAATAIAAFFLGNTQSFVFFTVLISVIGFMTGIRGPSIQGAITDSAPKKSRGSAFGIYQLFRFTPMLFGSLFGGATAYIFGYQSIFSLHSVLAISATLIVFFLSIEAREIAERGKKAFMTAGKIALLSVPNTYKFLGEYRSFAFLMIAFIVHGFAYFVGTSFWALYAKKGIDLSITSIGLVMSANAFGLWVGAVPSGKLTDRIGGWIMIIIHIVLTTPVTILYVLSPSLPIALLTSFLHGLVGSLDGPARPVVYSNMVGEEKIGAAIGITDSFVLLGRMMGPIAAGFLWSYVGISAPFWISGFINLLSLIPLGIALRIRNP